MRALPGVERCSATEGGYEVALREGADAARVMQSVIAAVPVARIELKRPTLEDVFVSIVAGGDRAGRRARRARRMNKVWQIAVREFVATVFTKGFIIGLLIFPTIAALMVVFGPRLFGNRNLTVEGEIAVVDPTGVVLPRVRDAVTARRSPVAVSEIVDRARAGGAQDIVLDVLGATTRLTLVERPADADVEREKLWLTEPAPAAQHLALVVLHANAVEPAPGTSNLGSYDLFVPAKQDNRVEIAVQGLMRDAIIDARVAARDLNREELTRVTTVARVRSVTVTTEGERGTVGGLNFILPVAFTFLLFMGVMGAGQGMLTTTVEEKSSRVIEVLLSAVSPLRAHGRQAAGPHGHQLARDEPVSRPRAHHARVVLVVRLARSVVDRCTCSFSF